MKAKEKRRGRPALTVRMDAEQLERLYRLALRADYADTSALIRGLVAMILDGSPEVWWKTLGRLARARPWDGEHHKYMVMDFPFEGQTLCRSRGQSPAPCGNSLEKSA